jgi:LysM repeat protein
MADRRELIGPQIITENPYTGIPLADPASPNTSVYKLQASPKVSWGATKKHSTLWVESQWNIEGEAVFYPGTRIRSTQVVTLKGLGNSLSGKWWVNNVTYQIQGGGLSVQANLIRDAFGKDTPEETSQNPDADRKAEITPEIDTTNQQEYVVKDGDSLWMIALRFYGDGSQYIKIAQANNITNPDIITPGTILVIP